MLLKGNIAKKERRYVLWGGREKKAEEVLNKAGFTVPPKPLSCTPMVQSSIRYATPSAQIFNLDDLFRATMNKYLSLLSPSMLLSCNNELFNLTALSTPPMIKLLRILILIIAACVILLLVPYGLWSFVPSSTSESSKVTLL